MNPSIAPILAAVLSTCALPAQQVPLPGDPPRCLQLIDLGERPEAKGPELVLVHSAPPPAAPSYAELIAFVRAFVQPPLQDGDDVQVLGGRWLAVLARPEQGACAEQLVQQARQRRDDLITTQVTLLELDADLFAKVVAPLLPAADAAAKGPRKGVLDAAATAALRATLRDSPANVAESPSLATRPLERGEVSHFAQISYVKDVALTAKGGSFVAEPVMDVVRDGVSCKMIVAFTGNDQISLACWLEKCDVQQPLRTFSTTLGSTAAPVSIQLPEVRTIRLQQTAQLRPGSSAVIASQEANGKWLLALVQATVQKK